MSAKKMTMGVIVGNRGFFPDHLAKTGREEMIRAVEKARNRSPEPAPEMPPMRPIPNAARRARRRN